MDWDCIHADLERWILGNASHLSLGSHKIVLPTSTPVDPPILMFVRKGQSCGIGFARVEPCDRTLPTRAREANGEEHVTPEALVVGG